MPSGVQVRVLAASSRHRTACPPPPNTLRLNSNAPPPFFDSMYVCHTSLFSSVCVPTIVDAGVSSTIHSPLPTLPTIVLCAVCCVPCALCCCRRPRVYRTDRQTDSQTERPSDRATDRCPVPCVDTTVLNGGLACVRVRACARARVCVCVCVWCRVGVASSTRSLRGARQQHQRLQNKLKQPTKQPTSNQTAEPRTQSADRTQIERLNE